MVKKKVEQSQAKCECKDECCGHMTRNGSSNCTIYGMGLVGAAIYFFPQASTLAEYAMAAFQSIVWPATLVYQALSLLKVTL